MRKGKLIIFSAPSGSGKTSVIQYLLQQDLPLRFSISATSRQPRGQEEHGKDYYFFTEEEFRRHIDAGDFLEYEEVYKGKFYGTLRGEVERILSEGGNVIFDVDVAGGLNIKQVYGEQALLVFIMPPSVEELRRRLEKRGTDAAEVIDARLKKAEYEMSFAKKFDKVIINDSLAAAQAEAVQTVREFLSARRRTVTGIFSGSFNPIHIGHLALANYLCEYGGLDELWFMVSPQNPLKSSSELMDEALRLQMVQAATAGYSKFRASDFEFSLPRPSYTINTLLALRQAEPDRDFHLITGADSWQNITQWKDYEKLITEFSVIVYPRAGYEIKIPAQYRNVKKVDAPLFEVSSTFIRKALAEGKDVRYFLPSAVLLSDAFKPFKHGEHDNH